MLCLSRKGHYTVEVVDSSTGAIHSANFRFLVLRKVSAITRPRNSGFPTCYYPFRSSPVLINPILKPLWVTCSLAPISFFLFLSFFSGFLFLFLHNYPYLQIAIVILSLKVRSRKCRVSILKVDVFLPKIGHWPMLESCMAQGPYSSSTDLPTIFHDKENQAQKSCSIMAGRSQGQRCFRSYVYVLYCSLLGR